MENLGITSSEPQAKLDEKWFSKFESATSGLDSTESLLDGDKKTREAQKAEFVSGTIENPTLDYPHLNSDTLSSAEESLLELKKEINLNESNEALRLAYRWKINEQIATIRMLQCTQAGDMRRFGRYAEFVYGSPSPDYFALSVDDIQKTLKKHFESDDPRESALAQSLAEDLRLNTGKFELPEKPTTETVQAVSELVEREITGLGINFPEGKEIETDEIERIFTLALEVVGGDRWKIIRDPDRTKVDVSQEKETVRIPEERTIDELKLKKLVMHEIVRHVGRRVSGENSRLSLLGLGLDRYIKGEEGVTKVTETAVEGKFKTYGTPELHLAVGLAKGLDGTPRDFRGVYDALVKHFTLKAIRLGKDFEAAEKEGQDKAWNHCVRVFRGTDCKTPGTCFPKDMVYREGSIGVWNILSKDTREATKFTIGKYDPANSRHLWVLSQLGITDEALESVEK